MNHTTPISSPEALMSTFADRLNAGDLAGLMELYEDHAVFEPSPSVLARGASEIRAALLQLLALQPRITSSIEQVLTAGDIALVVNRWSLAGTGPDGAPITQSGRSTDVLRRQTDGAWRVLIDKP
jgi:uncharacterized protein (TIGR02246 family)